MTTQSPSGRLPQVPILENHRHTPSSITPVPHAAAGEEKVRMTGTARKTAIAGLAVGGVTIAANMVQALGGLGEVTKSVLALIAAGWPGAIVLLALSFILIHLHMGSVVRTEAQADRALAREQQAARDGQMIRILNSTAGAVSELTAAVALLVKHADGEDLAHQRGEVATEKLLAAITELRKTIAIASEPTTPGRPRPAAQTQPPAPAARELRSLRGFAAAQPNATRTSPGDWPDPGEDG
jgi:hypothetical protein